MARLLAPEVFGLVAMLEVFIVVAEKFIYAGFGGALIQKKEVSQVDESTLFWYNLAVAVTAYGVLFLAAPWIAAFYDQVELTDILRVSALGLIIGGLNVVHGVRFTRQMDFRIPTIADLCGTLVMGISGIAFAMAGHGVWSLVWSNLVRRTTSCVILWVIAKWRPTMEFSREAMRYIAGYGSPILAASLLDGVFSNLHTVFIGKNFAAADLGFFNRGRAVQSIAVQSSTQPLLSVLFPSFSKMQDDLPRMKKGLLKTLRLVSLVLCPILFCVAAVSAPLIAIVYGERWLPSAPYLFWLACFGMWLPLSGAGFSIFKSLGKGGRYLKMSLTRHGYVLAGILAGLPFGIEGVIIGMGLAQMAVFASLFWTLRRELDLRISEGFRAVSPPLLIALTGLLAATALPLAGTTVWIELIARSGVFLTLFAVACMIFKPQAIGEILAILRPVIERVPGGRRLFEQMCRAFTRVEFS